MAGFDFHLPVTNLPPLAAVFSPIEFPEPDEMWPPPTPEPDLNRRGLTEARCVFQFFHGRTTDERLDALKHLANICMKKSGTRAYFAPKPYVKFVGAKTSRHDWENCDPYQPVLQKTATRGWFLTALPEHISKYSPTHVTKRELLELARIKDPDLLHVCHALLCDLLNESSKQARHEIHTTRLWEHDGQEFYYDDKSETAVQPTAPNANSFDPDYAGAVETLVKDKKLRSSLPRAVRQTLELVFRKLDSKVHAADIVSQVSEDLGRDERTIRRHLSQAREIANDVANESGQLMEVLASFVLPEDKSIALSTPVRPQVDILAESRK